MNRNRPILFRRILSAAGLPTTLVAAVFLSPFAWPHPLPQQDDTDEPETPALKESAAPEPITVALSPAVTRLLESPVLSEQQKTQRRLYHGLWDQLDPDALTPAQAAHWHAMRGTFPEVLNTDNPDEVFWNVQTKLRRGHPDDAAAFLEFLPEGDVSPAIPRTAAELLRAHCDEALALFDQAAQRLRPIREAAQHDPPDDPVALTAAAEAIVLLARLEGRPAADYRLALSLLQRAIDRDPLAWEPRLAQARLLFDKDNPGQAAELVDEVLALNPRSVEAWELGARLSLKRWDFAQTQRIIEKIASFAPDHPAVAELTVRRALLAGELDVAKQTVEGMQRERPISVHTLAWNAATAARRLDFETAERELTKLDNRVPGHPLGPFTVAEVMAHARRYADAEPMFRRAIEYQPNDAAPRLALGLMLMQLGDLAAAREELADAAFLDPFHAGVNNSLELVDRMLGWPTIQTNHFLVRYAPGPDAALARDLPPVLEAIRADLRDVFGQATDTITQVELLPDAETFAVRITGESELGALAACTGDVLAMAPPRLGAAQTGVYHWANVIRHEYVHAVVFDLSGQLAPRWFHEGVATYFEELERSFNNQRMLAEATNRNELIPIDELPAAFLSPRIGYAYQQAGWMTEFIVSRWGTGALNTMLGTYARAGDDADALRAATSLSPEAFTDAFEQWAEQQVRAWGLHARPMPPELLTALRAPTESIDRETLDTLEPIANGHPAYLRLASQHALDQGNEERADSLLTRLALQRPTDPWPQRQLAALALRRGDKAAATEVLEWLDRRDLSDPQWAIALARLARENGDFDAAYGAAERALYREPYNASFRELAATVALQGNQIEPALLQIRALVDLEPDEPQHQRRLEAVRRMMNPDEPVNTEAR